MYQNFTITCLLLCVLGVTLFPFSIIIVCSTLTARFHKRTNAKSPLTESLPKTPTNKKSDRKSVNSKHKVLTRTAKAGRSDRIVQEFSATDNETTDTKTKFEETGPDTPEARHEKTMRIEMGGDEHSPRDVASSCRTLDIAKLERSAERKRLAKMNESTMNNATKKPDHKPSEVGKLSCEKMSEKKKKPKTKVEVKKVMSNEETKITEESKDVKSCHGDKKKTSKTKQKIDATQESLEEDVDKK